MAKQIVLIILVKIKERFPQSLTALKSKPFFYYSKNIHFLHVLNPSLMR